MNSEEKPCLPGCMGTDHEQDCANRPPCLRLCQCTCGGSIPCVHVKAYELHADGCPNAKPAEPQVTSAIRSCICDRSRLQRADWCVDCPERDSRNETGLPPTQPKSEPPIDAVQRWVDDWATSEDSKEDIRLGTPWSAVARAYLAIAAQLREQQNLIHALRQVEVSLRVDKGALEFGRDALKAEVDTAKAYAKEAEAAAQGQHGRLAAILGTHDALHVLAADLKAENAELRSDVEKLLECCGDMELKRRIKAKRQKGGRDEL